MPGEHEQYLTVCKPRFDELLMEIRAGKDETAKLTKRLFQSNGERALVEIIRDNTQENKRIDEKLNEHIKDSDRPLKTVKSFQLSKAGLLTKGYGAQEVKDIIKMILAGVIVVLLVADKLDVGTKLLAYLMSRGQTAQVAVKELP